MLPKIIILLDTAKELDHQVFEKGQKDFLKRMDVIFEESSQIENFLKMKKGILQDLIRFRMTRHELKYYLQEILDQIQMLNQKLSLLKDMLNQIHYNFNNHLQIIIHYSRRKRFLLLNLLQLVFVFFLPFSIITGVFSMNIPIPFKATDTYNDLTAFWVLVSTQLGMSIGLVIIGIFYLIIARKMRKMKKL